MVGGKSTDDETMVAGRKTRSVTRYCHSQTTANIASICLDSRRIQDHFAHHKILGANGVLYMFIPCGISLALCIFPGCQI